MCKFQMFQSNLSLFDSFLNSRGLNLSVICNIRKNGTQVCFYFWMDEYVFMSKKKVR